MRELAFYRQKLLARARQAAEDLRQAGLRLAETDWYLSAKDDSLTPHQALAILAARHVQEFASTLAQLLDGGENTLSRFDPGKWLKDEYSDKEKWNLLYEGFAKNFTQILNQIEAVDSGKWMNAARHPQYGVHTLQWWLEKELGEMEETLGRIRKGE